MSVFEGYQSDYKQDPESGLFTYELKRIEDSQIEYWIILVAFDYMIVNRNLIVPVNIQIKNKDRSLRLSGQSLFMPKPVHSLTGTCGTLQENPIYYSMTTDGHMRIQGDLKNVNDSAVMNFTPYIAKFPIEIDEVDIST